MNPVVIGNATLYLGDAREIGPALQADAVVSDPPYGQGYVHSGHGRAVSNNATSKAYRRHREAVVGDEAPFDPSPLLAMAPEVILWGAHRFADKLPPGTWLVWDKVPTGKKRAQGDGEAAWKNDQPPRAMRIIRHLWDGVCVADRDDLAEGRVHPMQKPVTVMSWCIAMTSGATIADPYMGSGSTGVAAIRAGRRFIGIEIDERHFATACRRIEDAQRQGDLLLRAGA